MSENDASTSDATVASKKSISASSSPRRFLSKLQLILKQVSKASGASTTMTDTCSAENTIPGPVTKLPPRIEKSALPSNASAVSERPKVSTRKSLSKLSSRVENDSQRSGASSTSKDSGSAKKSSTGSISKIFWNLQRFRSNAECPSICPPKQPIIRSRAYPGPSNLAEHCRGSTIQLVPAAELDVLAKYWHFRNNFDRLARRGYRQGEEIECLLRCTRAPPRLFGLDGYLSSAHRELYKGLDRLNGCIKKEEAHLDEDVARIVLDETNTFMNNLGSLTGDLEFACRELQDAFDNAICSEGSLECTVFDSRTVFSEAWERRYTSTCWNLYRETQRLTYAIRRQGRKSKSNPAEVTADESMQEQDSTCTKATVKCEPSDNSLHSLRQAAERDELGIEEARDFYQ